ncbi:alpha/beta hydrolase-fold protein [Tistrella mobilis]|uniref:alpha/beta hydrolase n=1 Tax=Tistrella mobilis TaxID=171437 RepID=UPI0035581A70
MGARIDLLEMPVVLRPLMPFAAAFVLAFALSGTPLPARAAGAPGVADAVPVAPGLHAFDLTAARNGLTYRVDVSVPPVTPPPGGFPVLYVLDGNAFFSVAGTTARLLGWERPIAVVAIGYPGVIGFDLTRRYLDFTSAVTPRGRSIMGTRAPKVPTGGDEAFLDVILNEIRPEVARRFPVNDDRASLFGHSLGGRFVLHAAFTRPHAFRRWMASSPSIWWNDRELLTEEANFAARADRPALNLTLAVGGAEQDPEADDTPERVAFRNMARMVDGVRDMYARLAELQGDAGHLELLVVPDEGHISMVPAALARAVRRAGE